VIALLAQYAGRRPDARQFALRYRVLLLRAENGVPLNAALGAMPFEIESVRRSSLWRVAEAVELRTCSAVVNLLGALARGRKEHA
jgi:hypothetical protein